MSALTNSVPKPLLPCVQESLLEHLMQTLNKAGVSLFTVGVGWHGEEVARHIHHSGFHHVTEVVSVEGYETGPLQTLVTALRSIAEIDDVLVVPADAFIPVSMFREIIHAHTRGDLVTLAVDPNAKQGTPVYVDTENRLTGIGTPTNNSHCVGGAAMFFVAKYDIVDRCIAAQRLGMTRVVEVLNWLLSDGEHIDYRLTTGTWFDIDTIHQLLALNCHVLRSDYIPTSTAIVVRERDTLHFGQLVRLGRGTVVESNVNIEGPCVVTEGCHIGQGCHIGPDVVIRDRSILMDSCAISKSVIFGQSVVPAHTKLESAVIYKSHVYR